MTLQQIWQERSARPLPHARWSGTPRGPGAVNVSSRWRYAIAFALAVIGFLIRLLLHPYLGPDTPITLSIVAVALAAWTAGFGPGVLATFLSLLGATAFFLPPWGGAHDLSLAQAARLLMFFLTGIFVCGLTEALTRTRGAYIRSEQDQENRILQERNRMAREIHDTLAQGLTGIIIQLEAAEDMLPESSEEAQTHIARAQDLARHSLSEARRSVQALRPQVLEEKDLAGALAHYAEQMTAGTGIEADVQMEGVPPDTLSAEIQSNLLRIGVEALTNALKHARAEHIAIHLTFEPTTVTLSVRDNGRGFVPHGYQAGGSSGGFGLTGMWERSERIGGHFTLASQKGGGTEVRVTVQLSKAARSFFGGLA